MKHNYRKLGRALMLLLALALVLAPLTTSMADDPASHNNSQSDAIAITIAANGNNHDKAPTRPV